MIPLLWTVIGSSAAVLLSVPQDYGLVVAGLIVLGVGLGRVLHASYADYSEPV